MCFNNTIKEQMFDIYYNSNIRVMQRLFIISTFYAKIIAIRTVIYNDTVEQFTKTIK